MREVWKDCKPISPTSDVSVSTKEEETYRLTVDKPLVSAAVIGNEVASIFFDGCHHSEVF